MVDDDDLVRSSLSILIDAADGFAYVSDYANAEAALEQVPLDPPDVLLMDISIETVRTHLRRIYKKLHVTSRTEAAAKFLKG